MSAEDSKSKLFSLLDKGIKDFKNFKKANLTEIKGLCQELLVTQE